MPRTLLLLALPLIGDAPKTAGPAKPSPDEEFRALRDAHQVDQIAAAANSYANSSMDREHLASWSESGSAQA